MKINKKILIVLTLTFIPVSVLVIKAWTSGPSPCISSTISIFDLNEYKKRALNGDIKSAIELYDYYSSCGFWGNKEKWMEVAANNGDANFQFLYGIFLLTRDIEKGVEWIEVSSTNGFTDASLRLGGFYENGEYVKKDLAKALHYYKLAAESGAVLGMLKCAEFAMKGIETAEKPNEVAKFWAEKALSSTKPGSVYSMEAKKILAKLALQGE